MSVQPAKVRRRRHDPYKNFRFRVKWDGRYVAGASKVSALNDGRAAGSGRSQAAPLEFGQSRTITLERGVTHHAAFDRWAVAASSGSGRAETPLHDFRRDLTIDIFNEAGKLAESFAVTAAWVSEYQSIPDLDANGNAIAITWLKIEHEGCQRLS